MVPEDFENYRTLGWCYRGWTKFDLAIQNYKKVLEFRPSDGGIHFMLANLLIIYQNNIQEGFAHLIKGHKLVKEKWKYPSLGNCLTHIGEYELAAKYLFQYLERQLGCALIFDHNFPMRAQENLQKHSFLMIPSVL